MNHRSVLAVFAATLFTSAFLIFSVQPMVSKMLLPLLGGSPSVWNTAMVFFQAMLLAGYAYAHFVARYLPLRAQAFLHIALLLLFTAVLPLALPPDAAPPESSGQAWWQLSVMLTCVGGPFFVLAASAPLFQHWFAASGHEDSENPYFLYAVSNTGSLLSLLGYPVLIEPLLGVKLQTQSWFAGYILLIVLTAACAWLVRNGRKPLPPSDIENVTHVTWTNRFVWIALSFVPSSLMLGVTTLITTDMTSAPFLWVLPLALYLGTFIIAFSRNPVISLSVTRMLAPYLIVFTILSLMITSFVTIQISLAFINLLTFFFCALLCHGELAESKPAPSHLTEFFLLISVGGVLGGIFNALVAPLVFAEPIEYSLTLATIGFIVWIGLAKQPVVTNAFNDLHDKMRPVRTVSLDLIVIAMALGLFLFVLFSDNGAVQVLGVAGTFFFLLLMVPNRFIFAVTACAALLMFQPSVWNTNKKLLALDRNYFGSMKVYTIDNMNFFFHGTTLHGAQFRTPQYMYHPVTYYSPEGPASNVFSVLDKKKGPQKIGVIGLGVGSVACYPAKGRHFDFYEIDKDVVKIAENRDYFSYLSDCGSPYNVILGDARLKMEEQPDGLYDMIFLDAFSSDNIPTHLLTREAMALYIRLLKPHGILAMNISNRFIDLRLPLDATFKEMGMPFYYKFGRPNKIKGDVSELYTASIFAVAAREDKDVAAFIEDYGWGPLQTQTGARPWTDDYANIFSNLFLWE